MVLALQGACGFRHPVQCQDVQNCLPCAFKHNLETRAIIEDKSAEDGVRLGSYCQKHSLNSKKKPVEDSDSESGLGSQKSTMTTEEKSKARRQKMAEVEKEFQTDEEPQNQMSLAKMSAVIEANHNVSGKPKCLRSDSSISSGEEAA